MVEGQAAESSVAGRRAGELSIAVPEYRTKADVVYTSLRQLLLSAELLPGEVIDQERISKLLGVSRMPLRQALIRLASDGLVTLSPHHSATVTPMLADEISEIYATREAIETLLTRVAMQRLTSDDYADLVELAAETRRRAEHGTPREFAEVDRQFHMRLYRVGGYGRALGYFEKLRDLSDRYVAVYYSHQRGKFARDALLSTGCHEGILAACAARDSRAAVRAMRADLRRTAADLMMIAAGPGAGAPTPVTLLDGTDPELG
ncbi:MAG TPA: GntR family transcriptional regulator [Acidimicrobiales bacterium]|nr:GntR family transcriptional regulator [Acidimicrobiales bacterium]